MRDSKRGVRSPVDCVRSPGCGVRSPACDRFSTGRIRSPTEGIRSPGCMRFPAERPRVCEAMGSHLGGGLRVEPPSRGGAMFMFGVVAVLFGRSKQYMDSSRRGKLKGKRKFRGSCTLVFI